jgi:hypothetical protein
MPTRLHLNVTFTHTVPAVTGVWSAFTICKKAECTLDISIGTELVVLLCHFCSRKFYVVIEIEMSGPAMK